MRDRLGVYECVYVWVWVGSSRQVVARDCSCGKGR